MGSSTFATESKVPKVQNVDKSYLVTWSKTGIDELAGIRAYPPHVKERILVDSFRRLSHSPTLTAKQMENGLLEGYWVQ